MKPDLLREHKDSFGPYLRTHREARRSLRTASESLGIKFAKLQKTGMVGRFRIDSTAHVEAISALNGCSEDESLAGDTVGA